MSKLSEIGVKVEAMPAEGGLGPALQAVLAEVARMLEDLAAGGHDGAIDLRSLPLSEADRGRLLRVLGEGEVHAVLDADGVSNVRETGVPGVWWVDHRDSTGTVRAELLDVAFIPELLVARPREVLDGARALREELSRRQSPPGAVGEHARGP